MLDYYAYESVADFVKALSHEKRLQLVELLSSQERCVEDLANSMGIGIKSVSAHLRVMRTHGVLTTRKEGLRVYYRLRNNAILELYQHILDVALEGKDITPLNAANGLCLTLHELLAALQRDDVTLIDVRDRESYAEGHIPGAISVPIDELEEASATCCDADKLLIVYCEGYYCIQALDAVRILLAKQYPVKVYRNGLKEWADAGFKLAKAS